MSEDPRTLDALLDRLRARDAAAFEQLVRATTPRLLATARRFLRNEQAAQDAVQEAFVQAYKALPLCQGRAGLPTWLHAIVVRACLMRLRRERSRPESSIEELLPTFAADGHRQDVGPAWRRRESPDAAATAEDLALVRQSIDRLPEDFRNVVLLRDIEQLDTRAAAETLGVSASVVKTRLHRAHQALRTLLDPHFRNE